MNRVLARRVAKIITIGGFGSVIFLIAFLALWGIPTIFHYDAAAQTVGDNIPVLVAACMLISTRLFWDF